MIQVRLMNQPIPDLAAFDAKSKWVNVIVENSKGSHFKYVYTKETGLFRIKRVLPRGMVFPFNFGFIPSTLGADGDPMDILIVNDEPVVAGCLLKARLLGVVKARQTENGKTMRNDRLVGAIADEESPPEFLFAAFDQGQLAQIEFFFATYNRVSGKSFKVLGAGNARQAQQIVQQGIKRFRQSRTDEWYQVEAKSKPLP
jgi:inorganic pyrophosphatase